MGSTFSSTFESIHLEYQAMGSTFSSAFENIRIEHRAMRSTFSSAFNPYTLWISSYGFEIQLCIRKHSIWISNSRINIQFFIQNHKHFKYRAMGSTFRPAFENIHPEYQVMKSTFSSAFNTIHTLTVELWVQHSTFILNIELCDRTQFWISSCGFDIQLCIRNYSYWTSSYGSTFSSAFNTIHTLNIELLDRHSALHSKTYIMIFKEWLVLNVELKVDLTARYSGRIFSNAELNVDPIARYSKYVWCWMQSWTSIS